MHQLGENHVANWKGCPKNPINLKKLNSVQKPVIFNKKSINGVRKRNSFADVTRPCPLKTNPKLAPPPRAKNQSSNLKNSFLSQIKIIILILRLQAFPLPTT